MSGKDVEMTDAEAKPQAPAVPEVDPVQLLVNDLRSSLVSLERAVSAKDQRLVGRVLRSIPSLRRRLTGPVLLRVMRQYVSDDTPNLSVFTAPLSGLGDAGASMEVEASAPAAARSAALPEIEVFLSMLAVILMLDKNRVDEAIAASTSLLERVRGMNRRTLDPLSAKVYFYYARSYELGNRLAEIRPVLLDLYRTACLHHSETGQATLLNLLLRNYLHFNLYDQAFKLVSKTAFPENRSNNQNARYLYYLGRIKAVQLEYSDAYAQLMQAARKAPQTAAARGFRVAVQKLTFIVQLLMGEIPERSGFEHPETRKQLRPYFMIAQAVRVGDLAAFHQVTSKFAAVFKLDNTLTLINRLRHNVIKTGLRRINVSYSRISLADVAAKLHLDSAADAECIVAKAIRDGVIDAVIDHEGGFVQSKETVDLYSTQEPQLAFHKRIAFCLNIHNDAVKAMTFPANAHKVELENAAERREREAQEAELAQSMADEDDDEVL